MNLWRRLLPALALLALVAVAPAAAAPPPATPAPPTLTGETLTSPFAAGGIPCTGSTGSFTFSAAGTATGPYPGTFTETGSGTVNPANTLATFTATFTIHSTAGDVTGTKTFSGTAPGVCFQNAGNISIFGAIPTTYQATIHTTHGNYTDHGTSTVQQFFESAGTIDGFRETFASTQTETTLVVPTSKDACKDGSWESFGGIFKNQGDCVSFVATGGKNPPSGA
jgi:hypothetical protein